MNEYTEILTEEVTALRYRVKELETENTALKARLEKAVELPCYEIVHEAKRCSGGCLFCSYPVEQCAWYSKGSCIHLSGNVVREISTPVYFTREETEKALKERKQ